MINSFGEMAHLLLYIVLQPLHAILSIIDELHCPAQHTVYEIRGTMPYDLCGGPLPKWCYMLKKGLTFWPEPEGAACLLCICREWC